MSKKNIKKIANMRSSKTPFGNSKALGGGKVGEERLEIKE